MSLTVTSNLSAEIDDTPVEDAGEDSNVDPDVDIDELPMGGNASSELGNTPATCLPNRAKRTTDPNECQCPPASHCNKTIRYEGSRYDKLSEQLYNRCCATTPTPNICDTNPLARGCTIQGIDKCQVNFVSIPNPYIARYEHLESLGTSTPTAGYGQGAGCMSTTIIGPRTARYCKQYKLKAGVVAPALQTKINQVNACIQNNCYRFKHATLTYNRKSVSYAHLKTHEKLFGSYIFYNQEKRPALWLKNYNNCHQDCLETNNVDAWRSNPENRLSTWLNLRLHAPAHLIYAVHHHRTMPQHGVVTADADLDQIWQQVNYTTINQRKWSLYFNSTKQPEKINPSYPKYSYKIGTLDKFLGSRGAHTAADNEFSGPNGQAFFRSMRDLDFKPVGTIVRRNNTPYAQPGYPDPIRCQEYEDFQTCVLTSSSDGACGSCLSPETKITLADGTTKLIKDIKIGDTLQAAHNITTTVEKIVKLDWPTLTLYNINDGALKLTPDHPIMTTKGWRAVNYNARGDEKNETRYGLQSVKPLTVGDVIVTEKGEVPVTRIMPEPEVKDAVTYNLKVKGDASSFYANGILVKSHK